MIRRSRLGDILVSHGTITEAQLAAALAHQSESGCRLGEALVAMDLCSEVEIARALADQMELPFVDLTVTQPQPQALRLLPRDVAAEYGVVPIRVEGQRLLVAALNPLDIRIDEVVRKATRLPVTVASAPASQVATALQNYSQRMWSHERPQEYSSPRHGPRVGTLPGPPSAASVALADAQITRQVDTLIADGIRKGARDICFESQADGLHVRARLDGEWHVLTVIPQDTGETVGGHVKKMFGFGITMERRPRSARRELRVDGNLIELVARTFSAQAGEVVAIRACVPMSTCVVGELGFQAGMLARLRTSLVCRQGVVLVSGPMDSGRTTTLYSLLRHFNSERARSVTIEDTVELRLPGVTQLELEDPMVATFSDTLTNALSQSPDVLMLGELPDKASAEAVCQYATGGGLALVCSNAPHALRALARLLDLGITPYLAASALTAVLSQRLARRVCDGCSEPYNLPPDLERVLGATFGSIKGVTFRKGWGCAACGQKGTRGRIGIFELLLVDEDFRHLLSQRVAPSVIQEHITRHGFRSLEDDAFVKAAQGLIPPEEIVGLRLGVAQALEGVRV